MRLALAVLGLGLVAAVGAQEGPRLGFPAHGFSLATLEGTSETQAVEPVVLMLPATEGFAPSVNVQVQPYAGTLAEYATLSEGQFKALHWKVKKRAKEGGAVSWEYTGTNGGQKMHWYARVVVSGSRAYLATATALESQWAAVADQLRACVDSLRLTAAPAPPIADKTDEVR